MSVYNFGSINIDAIYRVPHLVQPGETLASKSLQTVLGGKGANQSVALARAGVQVKHIGAVNNADQWAVEEMEHAGVDCSLVSLLPTASGHAIIQVDDQGENSIVLHGGANQEFSREHLVDALRDASPDDVLLIQNECNALADVMDIAMSKGMKIAINPAPMTDSVTELPLADCSVLFLNEIEASQLTQCTGMLDVRKRLRQRFPNTNVVLTLGSKGAELLSTGGDKLASAFAVNVVDTTGAGDTFVGYYLAAGILGLPPEEALERSCAAAALSVSVEGATPSIPLSTHVDQFLQENA